jgi:recombination protein RecT
MNRTVRHDFAKPHQEETTMTDTQPSLSTAVQKADNAARNDPRRTIKAEVERYRTPIVTALPEGYTGGADRFIRTVLTAVAKDPNLLKCSPTSIIGAAMQAAQLGLTPGVLGEAWLIPYGSECTFQLGYKGLVALAARAGIGIRAHTVCQRDDFTYELGLDPTLRHVPATGDRGPGTHWYAVATHVDTGRLMGFAVLDRHMVDKRRKANRGKSPAWDQWYDEMALSKAVREVCRFLPLTVEMATALASDGVVRDQIDGQADEFVATYDDAVDAEVVEG